MGRRKKTEMIAEATTAPAGKPISKMAAVREALGQGIESPSDIVSYVKEKHGLEMTTAHVSAYKSTLKNAKPTGKKRGRKPGSVAVKPSANGSGSHGMISDAKLVRDLVKRLGASQVKELVGLFE